MRLLCRGEDFGVGVQREANEGLRVPRCVHGEKTPGDQSFHDLIS